MERQWKIADFPGFSSAVPLSLEAELEATERANIAKEDYEVEHLYWGPPASFLQGVRADNPRVSSDVVKLIENRGFSRIFQRRAPLARSGAGSNGAREHREGGLRGRAPLLGPAGFLCMVPVLKIRAIFQ